jgi:hypothetical protein
MKIITQSDLVNSLNTNDDVTFLLGAGCSIASGCLPSSRLIEDFKIRLYCSEHKIDYESIADFNEMELKSELGSSFKNETRESDYSFFFNKCFPLPFDRNKFIQEKFQAKNPSIGYLCFAHYLVTHGVHFVFTTNFDHLVSKALVKISPNYDVVNESEASISLGNHSLSIVSLHGDYNYDLIKNTDTEVSSLEINTSRVFRGITSQRIVVLGYSGMDLSVMNALSETTKEKPSFSIVWCLHDENVNSISPKISEVLANSDGSVIVPSVDFDDLFISLYKIYGSKQNEIDSKIQAISTNEFLMERPRNETGGILLNCHLQEFLPEVFCSVYSGKDHDNETAIDFKGMLYSLVEVPNSGQKVVALDKTELPTYIKIRLLKMQFARFCSQNNLGLFRNKVFNRGDGEIIKDALDVSFEVVKQNFVVCLNPTFTTGSEPTIAEKAKINSKKSNLFPKQNYALQDQLINKFFGGHLNFSVGNTTLSFYDNALSEVDLSTTRLPEPKMLINGNQSSNQLNLLYRFGPANIGLSPSTIKIGVVCLEEKKKILWNRLNQLINGSMADQKEGIIKRFEGFQKVFGKSLEWCGDKSVKYSAKDICSLSKADFLDFMATWVERTYLNLHPDIVLVFFSSEMASFRSSEEFDFHDALKLRLLNSIKTQIVEESTFSSHDDVNKILLNLSTALYTKTIGMPWQPVNFEKTKFFLGMSFGLSSHGTDVSCSQLFDGAGRGLKLLISNITNKGYRKNPYLTKDEAFQLGRDVRSIFYRTSSPFDLSKIVIHRTVPFKKEEINGFAMAFEGLLDFTLIQIVEYPSINGFAIKYKNIDGYPIKRGTIIKISNNEVLLWTDGSVIDDEVLPHKTYRSSKRGMGAPILIRKFYGTEGIEEVCSDILSLSKMDFNSSDVLYSRLPVTLKYAKMLAKILKQKSDTELTGNLVDFRYVM